MRQRRFYLFLLLTLLLKSCEVPDVQPFVKATSAMGVAIDAGLQQVAADLRQVTIPDAPAGSSEKIKSETATRQQTFAQGTAAVNEKAKLFSRVAHAFSAYAQALSKAAAAGEKQGAAIDKIFKATDELVAASTAYLGPAAGPAKAAVDGLKLAATTLSQAHTLNSLNKLASPQQDSVIQKISKVLRLGMADFASIDQTAYGLVINYKPGEAVDVEDYYTTALWRRQAAIRMLARITKAESYILLEIHQQDLLDAKGPLAFLADNDKDPKELLKKAYQAALKAPKLPYQPDLLEKLRQRELFYQELLAVPQAQYDTEQTLYHRKQADTDLLSKSSQAIDTWATSHHQLRTQLVQSSKVSAKELLAYAQATQKLVDAVKDIKK